APSSSALQGGGAGTNPDNTDQRTKKLLASNWNPICLPRVTVMKNKEAHSKKNDKQTTVLSLALSHLKNIMDDTIPCKIEEGLFVGSYQAAENKVQLKSLNITHVLTVANGFPPDHPDDFMYKVIEVQDSTSTILVKYFDECFQFIDEAKAMGGSILVHCLAGVSRSATIVVAYLMKKHGVTRDQALLQVKAVRPFVAPNPGFMKQLANFEKALKVQVSLNEACCNYCSVCGVSLDGACGLLLDRGFGLLA
ncbi:Dual specificity protein phosphatase 1-like protein, partial [Drosera capensis]